MSGRTGRSRGGRRCDERPRLGEAHHQVAGLDLQLLERTFDEDRGEAIHGGEDAGLQCPFSARIDGRFVSGVPGLMLCVFLLSQSCASQRCRMIVALWPPNPKALLIAVLMGRSRAMLGT